MSARDTVLGAVRAALGRSAAPPSGQVEAEAQALLADLDAVRPALPPGDLAAAFVERATAPQVGGTVDRVASLADLPMAVRRYLDEHGLPHALTLQPDPTLRALDWSGFELREKAQPNEAASLGIARWGIVETGSLVFHSGPDTAVLNNFLALHQLSALRIGDILPHLEDYAARSNPAPRNANLITGASGTADIEGSFVRGAHGPRFWHIILLES